MNPTDAILERIESLLQQLVLILAGPTELPSVPEPPSGKKPVTPGKP